MKYRIKKIVENLDAAAKNFKNVRHELNNILQIIILAEEKAKRKKERR